MTSMEKRHSGRRGSGHRKHSDGGYSDTSSGSSFLDETDREVCSLTDRAFRSLCIGEEAVYNDSDLCSSSPSAQRERQQAFSQENQEWDGGDRNRETLKRAAHESFSLSLQQYGQSWVEGGQYGAETLGDSQWGGYGEGRTEGRVSATFQRSFMDVSQQERALRDERLSFLSNGATDLSSQQQCRSRSRVSSLIKAFSSEGYSDGGGGRDSKFRDWNNESSWDKSALMSIQRELSEFSTAYHHNINTGPFPSRETSLYSSDMVDAVAQMDTTGTFMRSSHSKHSMLTQLNSNSNFFLHSEYSPFQVWRDHSRFPFRRGDVSGFMSPIEFPRWYDSPMYKELTFGHQIQGPSMFERKPLEAVAPPPPPRSTSTSTVLQKASALEKRCESELTGHYPHWKCTQSLGTNRLPSHRPSTVSPTNERYRRGRDVVSSITELQQKVTMVTTEQSMSTVMSAEQGGVTPYSNKITTMTVEQGVVSSNKSTTPFNISQLLTPVIHTHQDADTSEVLQYTLSPPLMVEQPPTRGESRGATPEVRMSSYKSRATSLLFNLKDNRKRVKSTYSPTKFKGLEVMDRSKQPSNLDSYEPKDVVIDIPDILVSHMVLQEEPRAIDAPPYPHSPSYYSHAQQSTTVPPTAVYNAQHTDAVKPDDYLTVRSAQTFGEMDYLTEFSGFTQGSYATKDQLSNRQNGQGGLSPFTPSWSETLADNVYRQVSPFKPDMNNTLPTLRSPLPKINPKPDPNSFRDTHRRDVITTTPIAMTGERYTGTNRYEQVRENTYGVSEAFSQGSWKEHVYVNNTTNRDTETFSLNDRVKPDAPPWKGEIAALIERDKRSQPSYKPAEVKQDLHSARKKYGGENKWNVYEKSEEREYITEERAYPTDEFLRSKNSLPNKDVFPVLDHTLANCDDLSNRQNDYAPIADYSLNQQIIADTPARKKRYSGAFMDVYGPQEQYGLNEYQTQNELLYGSTKQEYNKQTLYSEAETKYTVRNSLTEQKPVNVKPYTPRVEENNISRNEGYVAKQQDSKDVQWNSSFRNESSQYTENMSTTAQVKDNRQYNDSVQQANEFSAVRSYQYPRNDPNKIHIMPNENKIAKVELAESEHAKAKRIKAEQAQSELIKAERAKAELAIAKAERAKAELAIAKAERAKEELAIAKAERAKAEKVKAELAKVEEAKAAQAKAELARAEQARAERVKVEQAKAEQAKAEQAKAEQAKAEQAKAELAKAEKAKVELAKAELAKAELAKAELAKAEQAKAELAKAELAKAELAKAEQAKAEQAKAELAKAELAKAELAKAKEEQAKAELAKAEQAKAELAKAELAKAEQAKAELAKAELAKAELAKAEQAKAEQAIAELAKAELAKAKAEQAKAEQAKAELAKAEQAKAELAKAELAKVEQAKAEQAKAELAKAELAKAELAKVEQAKAEQAKAELAKAELAKAEQAKAELAKAELAKAELAKAELAKAEQAKAEQAKAELAKAELAKAELAKAELAKAEQAKAELAKDEQAKAELAKAELAKVEQAKAEQAKAELAKAELAKAELAKAELAKAELAKAKEEQAKAELAKAELAKAEQAKAELAKLEQAKKELAKAKAEQAKAQLAQEEQSKAEQAKVEVTKVEQAKAVVAKAKAELAKAKAQQAKAEQAKAKLTKAKLTKSEVSAKDNVSIGQSDKREVKQMPTETFLTKEYQTKQDITEGTGKLPKGIGQNNILSVGDDDYIKRGQVKDSKHGISDVVSLNNELYKDQDQPQKKYQQKDGSTISRYDRVNSDRGSDEYDRVREKYGFSHAVSSNGNKRFSQDVTATDKSKMSVSEVDTYDGASRNERYTKNEISSISRHDSAKEEEQEKINVSKKCEEVIENQYIYSESSKEFKLSSADVFATVESKMTTNETFTIKDQDQGARNDKHSKYDSLIRNSFDALTVKTDKHDVPAPRQNHTAKSILPKRVEQSVAPSKDTHSTAFRALSYKERGQTKQEIMTSKLKAHAEKEISAIKEKGFAMRDGLLTRNPTKHLTLGSSNNIRQKPPLREETKKDDHLKQDTASTRIKAETINFDQLSVRERNISESQASHSLKQEPLKRDKDTVKQPDATPVEAALTKPSVKKEASPFQSRGQAKTEVSLGNINSIERSKPESGAWSETHKTRESTNVLKEMEDASNVDSGKKQHPKLDISQSNKDESINENITEDQNTPLKLVLGKSEAISDSDSLQIMGIMVLIREKEQSGSDGLVNKDTSFTHEPTPTKDKENNKVEAIATNKNPHSSDQPPNKNPAYMKEEKHPALALPAGDTVSDNKYLTTEHCVPATSKTEEAISDVSVIAEKARVGHQTPLPGGKGETKKESAVSENNKHSNSVLETAKRLLDEEEEPVIKERGNYLQEESPSLNGSPQSQMETLLPDSPAVKDGCPAVVEPAKNKTLAETQPLLFKKGITARQTKEFEITAKSSIQDGRDGNVQENQHHSVQLQQPPREQTVAKKEKADSNKHAVSNRDNMDENLIKQDVQLKGDPAKYDLILANNRSTESQNAPLVVEKHPDPASEKQHIEKDSSPRVEKSYNKNSVTDNYSKGIPPSKHHIEMAQSEETNQAEENVHIDAVAIRVVPGAPERDRQNITENPLMNKDDIKGAEKHHRENHFFSKDVLNVTQEAQRERPQNSVTALDGNQQVSSSHLLEGKTLTSKDTERLKANLPASQKSETIQVNKEAQQISPPVRRETLPFGYSEHQQNSEDEQIFVLNKSRVRAVELNSTNERELVKTRGQNDGRIEAQIVKERGGPTETEISAGGEVGQNIHTRKHNAQTENVSGFSAGEKWGDKQDSHEVKQNDNVALGERERLYFRPEVTPKERVSTIPEISAIADYARLKVISTEEDRPSSTEDSYSPCKNKGYVPLIQTRHSRRPVFTTESPQDNTMKEAVVVKETEVPTELNKEAKVGVFSTMEHEQKRTGMFRLREKEKQIVSFREDKATESYTERMDTCHLTPNTEKADAHYLKYNTQPTPEHTTPSYVNNEIPGLKGELRVKEEEVLSNREHHKTKMAEMQQLNHIGAQKVDQSHNPLLPPPVLPLQSDSKTRNSSISRQLIPPIHGDMPGEDLFSPKAEATKHGDKTTVPPLSLGHMYGMIVEKREEERRVTQREEERRAKEREEERRAKEREEERRAKEREEEKRRATQREEERRRAKEREEESRAKEREESRAKEREEERRAKEREEERRAKEREEERRAKERDAERKVTQNARQDQINAPQYYAISTPEGERKPRDRPLLSPLPAQQRVGPSGAEPSEDWGYFGRPCPSASPAPSGPRSNTSSPALGAKPIMFRVKDNTFRGSSLTKSVKPRFHKSFGEDLRVGSPLGGWGGLGERGEEEKERVRESAGTPVYHDTIGTSHRLLPVKENLSKSPLPPSHGYHPTLSERRAHSRRSLALDEDDSRSVISTMSEDVESFATSAADLADFRYSGVYDSDVSSRGGYERPDSACSFSSDVARALGKPPTVPPKSDKALRRAKRLTTRRIKKETNGGAESTALVEKPLRSVASVPSSPMVLRSFNRSALASPHFTSPVSLPHAPTLVSRVPSSPIDLRPSHRSFHASPHATPPVSLPFASSHPVSLPLVPKSVASVPSSPTHHPPNPPPPVTQYHVEPSYASSSPSLVAQSFPLTQQKVLQDPGSGQYFVVNMPVQVKTKTFFDPETGKYVQLNVRQSAQSGSLSHPQPQAPYTQAQPQAPYTQAQPQALSQAPPASQPYVLYQGYQGYHQGYQPMPVSSLTPHRSTSAMSAHATLPRDIQEPQEPEPAGESQGWGQDTYGQSYSQEQVPYMDTAHDTQSQVGEGSVYGENENPAHSSSQARDIITMSELEDFAMDFSDW